MSGLPRPVLRRQSSKVRFSRGDMSPVGTMASDPSIHGIPHRSSVQEHPGQGQAPLHQHGYDEQELYDSNSYPFTNADISLSASRDAPTEEGGEYRQVQHDEPFNPYEHEQEYHDQGQPVLGPQVNDGYTATPPRVGSKRFSMSQRPQLDTLYSGNQVAQYNREDVSPRGSTFNDPSSFPPQIHSSPAQRPVRSSLVMNYGSPRPQEAEHYNYPTPDSPHRIRASVPTLPATPRRLLEQQQHRISAPNINVSPHMAQFGSPHIGSPRQNQSPRPGSDFGLGGSGFKRFDQDERSPAPPYPSRGSGYFQGPKRDWDGQNQRYRQDYGYDHRGDRHDSDATLQGDYQGKEKLSPPHESTYRRPRASSDASSKPGEGNMQRKTTREVEDGDDDSTYHAKGGVFSQLLRLTGRGNNSMRRRLSSRGGMGMGSRANSVVGGELPTMKSLGLKRVNSTASTAFGVDEFDPDDPRVTGQKKTRKRAGSLSELLFRGDDQLRPKGKRRQSIQRHVADILTRQQFILKLAKALMTFGAPSHRIESQLAATALVLEIDAQFIHLPSIVIASFGDADTHTSETVFIKTSGGLELGKLHKVHNIYRAVVHDELDAGEGTRQIHTLLKADKEYNLRQRMILAFLCSGIISPLGFGGSLIDGLASGVLGILLSFMQLHVASKNAMYSNIFEISIATVISFTARGLATTGLFCYQGVASAGVVLILPGYVILCGSLELASKNIVAGSVRMVYAIIYSLFLGFGLTIGSDLFYVIDRPARRANEAAMAALNNVVSLSGTFTPLQDNSNPTASLVPFNGTFTFVNTTTDAVTSNLYKGAIICPRQPDWPWWRQSMPPIYLLALVPLFSLLLSLWNMQPLRSRQLPVMVVISCIGYLANSLANHYIFDRSDVVSAIGAFVIGILGNVYSRAFGGTAFTSMVTGVLFLVPSGIAAAGGLAMTSGAKHEDSYSQGLIIGFRMVQVAIGITVGLFGSGLLIYSFGRKKGAALFAF